MPNVAFRTAICDALEKLGELPPLGVTAAILGIPQARRVRVSVRKPQVSLNGPLAYAEVTLERAANE